jgi:CheY-like chemotaxis protein
VAAVSAVQLRQPAALVVDDNDDLREIMQEFLEHAGYPTVTAASGEDALKLVKAGARPRVVIVDLMMPGMSGSQLILALSEQLPSAAIVSVTAGDVPVQASISAGHLQKPFTSEQLLRVVARLAGPSVEG